MADHGNRSIMSLNIETGVKLIIILTDLDCAIYNAA